MPSTRRLVVCADGTWNTDKDQKDGGGRTNVAIVKEHLPARGPDGVEQLLFYDSGVGTEGGWFQRLTGGAFGSGLDQNIRDGYGWLVKTYRPGDELFFFGFSRGAYTVRSLAGVVRKCGLLRRLDGAAPGDPLTEKERKLIGEAYELYRKRGDDWRPSGEKATAWRAAHSMDVPIKALCVWDTVGALGVPTHGLIGAVTRELHEFHDVKLASTIQNAFHALAIDERRGPFAPSLWQIPADDASIENGQWKYGRVEQRWFAGVHSNVGGGYPDRGLSNIALRWMLTRAGECGLHVDDAFRQECERGCDCTAKQYDSMSPGFAVLGEHVRPIGRTRDKDGRPVLTFETVDDTVAERIVSTKVSPGYRPSNFLDYWKRTPGLWEGKYQRPG